MDHSQQNPNRRHKDRRHKDCRQKGRKLLRSESTPVLGRLPETSSQTPLSCCRCASAYGPPQIACNNFSHLPASHLTASAISTTWERKPLRFHTFTVCRRPRNCDCSNTGQKADMGGISGKPVDETFEMSSTQSIMSLKSFCRNLVYCSNTDRKAEIIGMSQNPIMEKSKCCLH